MVYKKHFGTHIVEAECQETGWDRLSWGRGRKDIESVGGCSSYVGRKSNDSTVEVMLRCPGFWLGQGYFPVSLS